MTVTTLTHRRRGSDTTSDAPNGRAALLAALLTSIDVEGLNAAFQGADDAVPAWIADTSAKDLDLWVDDAAADRLDVALPAMGGALIARADDPRRLRHRSWGFIVDGNPTVIDLTVGDLRVGPILLCPAEAIDTCTGSAGDIGAIPRLDGQARAADLLVRPLLRGRVPTDDRVQEARAAWNGATPGARLALAQRLETEMGHELTDAIIAVLGGEPPSADLARRHRTRLLRRSATPSALRSTWRQRSAIVPTRRPGPFGLRRTGALVVLIGTDGSGKSTLAAEAGDRLRALDLPVEPAYLGMVRGNLPGVATARRLLTGRTPIRSADTGEDTDERSDSSPVPASDRIRRIAAGYFAVEYILRSWALMPAVWRGRIVLCDRWVTDLRFHPWPGSRAATVAERLSPRPDVLALPDAPASVIHARKPERPVAETAAQQLALRGVLADARSGTNTVVLDTSGPVEPAVAELTRLVLGAAHRRTVS